MFVFYHLNYMYVKHKIKIKNAIQNVYMLGSQSKTESMPMASLKLTLPHKIYTYNTVYIITYIN